MKDNQNKKEDYLGSKFSEHVFGDKGGQVMDPYDAMRQIEEDSTEKFWRDMNVNNQYEKKETLSKI